MEGINSQGFEVGARMNRSGGEHFQALVLKQRVGCEHKLL
jgi:hypothetical protein